MGERGRMEKELDSPSSTCGFVALRAVGNRPTKSKVGRFRHKFRRSAS